MKFLTKFLAKEVDNAVTGFTSFLVNFDPETATEAQLEVFRDKFNALSHEVAKARQARDKEQKEADDIVAQYDMMVRAGEILHGKYEAAAGDEKKALEASLKNHLAKLEALCSDVEREKQEAVEAGQLYDELAGYITEFTAKMDAAKKQIEDARKSMVRAELDKQREQFRANAAEIKAGLTSDKSDLHVVVNAFNKKAQAAATDAEAARIRTAELNKLDAVNNDPLVAAAMKEAAGTSGPAESDFAARLAALKK